MVSVDLARVGLAGVGLASMGLTRVGLARVSLARVGLGRVGLTSINLVKVRCWCSWSLHVLISLGCLLRLSLELSVWVRCDGVVSNLYVLMAVVVLN